MKQKVVFAIVLSLLILGFLSTKTVHAAYGWYMCTVVATGQGSGNVYIALTDDGGAFTQKWFTVPSADVTSANRYLALALTAISTEKKLRIYTDPALATPNISTAYLYN